MFDIARHTRVHQILHGQGSFFDRQSAHIHVILKRTKIDWIHLLGMILIVKTALGKELVELGLTSLKGGVDITTAARLLSLVTAPARLSLGGSNASTHAAFLDTRCSENEHKRV